MLLGFNPQFVQPIFDGTKIHTLREDGNHRWKIGMSMQMATGIRTKNYNCFKDDAICKSIQSVFMSYDYMLHISIDNAEGNFGLAELYYPEKVILAQNDGFPDVKAFEEWFVKVLSKKPGKCCRFRLLHWTDFRY